MAMTWRERIIYVLGGVVGIVILGLRDYADCERCSPRENRKDKSPVEVRCYENRAPRPSQSAPVTSEVP